MLQERKVRLIEFLIANEILKFGAFKLKSQRSSPYFINVGDCNTGPSIAALGSAYANTLIESDVEFDVLVGPSYKGIPLAVTTAISLVNEGINAGVTFDRKEIKDYGEATGTDLQKQMLVGALITDGSRIVFIDDVMTTGATKYDIHELIKKCADGLQFPLLIIAVNRQEVGIDGKNAVEEFTAQTGIPVMAIIAACDIYDSLMENGREEDAKRIADYLRIYGTDEAVAHIGKIQTQYIIPRDRSVIPACDLANIDVFEEIVKQTNCVSGIGGYKIGFELALT